MGKTICFSRLGSNEGVNSVLSMAESGKLHLCAECPSDSGGGCCMGSTVGMRTGLQQPELQPLSPPASVTRPCFLCLLESLLALKTPIPLPPQQQPPKSDKRWHRTLAFVHQCRVRHKSPLWSHLLAINRGFNLLVFAV